jgi:hypothetical protein
VSNKALVISCTFLILLAGLWKVLKPLGHSLHGEAFEVTLELVLIAAWLGLIVAATRWVLKRKAPEKGA